MRKTTWAAAALVVLIGIAGFTQLNPRGARAAEEGRGRAGEPQVGAACRVILRGDATGYCFENRVVDLDSLISRKGTYGWRLGHPPRRRKRPLDPARLHHAHRSDALIATIPG